MQYDNLKSLISSNSVSRRYFSVLPADVQRELVRMGDSIHNANELHSRARQAESKRRSTILSHEKNGEA